MARDECCDCGEFHPYGEGLVDGRCPACLALFEERHQDASVEPEPTKETGEEIQPQPADNKEPPPAEEAEEEQ